MNIGVTGNIEKPNVVQYAQMVMSLLGAQGHSALLSEKLAAALHQPLGLSELQLACEAEMIIALGGDGTVMRAIRAAAPYDKPVLGVHLGTLGFLSELRPDALSEAISAITAGEYSIEKRTMIEAAVIMDENDEPDYKYVALNDLAVTRHRFACIMRLKLYVGDEFAGNVDCDGMLIATPTGSTSYAVSIGGPLVHPELDALILVPMAAHISGMHPMVIPANRTITIKPMQDKEIVAVTTDGYCAVSYVGSRPVKIRRAQQSASFVRLNPHHYFEVVRERIYGQKAEG